MADQWYYRLLGEEFGPVSVDEVARRVGAGELSTDDTVRKGTGGPWVTINSVSELRRLPNGGVAVQTMEESLDIDSFNLVDEQELKQPQLATSLDTFNIVDEQELRRSPGLADSLDSFNLVDEQELNRTTPMPKSRAPRGPEAGSGSSVRPASANWYVQEFGLESGPYTIAEMVSRVRREELNPTDLVRNGEQGEWIEAGSVELLFSKTRSGVFSRPTPAPQNRPTAQPQPANDYSAAPAAPVTHAYAPAAPAVDATYQAAPADVNWYCYINQQEYGPYGMTDFQSMAAAGQLTPDVYVKYGAQGEWLAAAQVPGLFAAPAAPAAPQAAPAAYAAPQSYAAPQPAAQTVTAVSASTVLAGSDKERTELVSQLLAMLKQGLSAELGSGILPAAPTAGGWFCNISGSVVGPVTIESLVQMVRQKRIFPDDLIRLGSTGEWFPASSVPELFPNSAGVKSSKRGVDDSQSVMDKIDKMYQDAEAAKAKLEAERAAAPASSRTSASEPSRSNAAGDALRNMNSNIARGNTASYKAAAAKASAGPSLGEQLSALTGGKGGGGVVAVILVAVLLIAGGAYMVPSILAKRAASAALDRVVALHAQIKEAQESGENPTVWDQKKKGFQKTLDDIVKETKTAASGSALKDVGKMARSLKEMVDAVGKPAAAGQDSDFARVNKIFEGYKKAVTKKLGR